MEIKMGEYKTACAPEMMETRSLGPCLGIAVYEPVARRGYLGHLWRDISLPEMISEIPLQGRESMRVTLTGMSFCTSRNDVVDRCFREYLARRSEEAAAYLQDCGFGRIEQRLSPDNTATSLRLDLNTGVVEISVKPLDELKLRARRA